MTTSISGLPGLLVELQQLLEEERSIILSGSPRLISEVV